MSLQLRTSLRRRYVGIAAQNARPVRRYFDAQTVPRLHVGCGLNILDGWLNCDLNPKRPDVLPMDATKRFPFDDGKFDYVYSEHFVEHIDYAGGQNIFRECYRILKPGGIIRITTPDLAFLVGLYSKNQTDQQRAYIEWATKNFIKNAPAARDVYVINKFFYCDWGHQFIYDKESLAAALSSAGFIKLTFHQVGESEHEYLKNLEHVHRMPEGFLQLESMTIEGQKPA